MLDDLFDIQFCNKSPPSSTLYAIALTMPPFPAKMNGRGIPFQNLTGGHLWFYRIRSKISSIIESTIFTSTIFLLHFSYCT